MERKEGVERLKLLIGKDIRQLVDKYGVSFEANGHINKGWFGHTLEHYLGLPTNSSQSPNFGSWELKSIPMKKLSNCKIVPKETMAITMIDPYEILRKDFYNSHLYSKLCKMVVVSSLFVNKQETSRVLLDVKEFDLTNKELLKDIENDFNLVKETIKTKGFEFLTGKMGKYIQPRTKGAGHGSTSRAFYARKNLISIIFEL